MYLANKSILAIVNVMPTLVLRSSSLHEPSIIMALDFNIFKIKSGSRFPIYVCFRV